MSLTRPHIFKKEQQPTFDMESLLSCHGTAVSFKLTPKRLTAELIHQLFAFLKTKPHITSFEIISCEKIDMAAFTQALANSSLEKIRLCDCGIDSQGAAELGRFLAENKTLKELDLSNNKLGERGAISLAAGLATNHALESLVLENNKLSCKAAKQLGEVLKKNSTLRELNLAFNQIELAGMVGLAQGLLSNKSLKKLNIDQNKFACKRAAANEVLATLLADNNTLEELSLTETGLTNEGMVLLGKGLADNTGLKVLSLRGNECQIQGAISLEAGLKKNKNLHELDLFGCLDPDDSDSIQKMTDGLAAHPGLRLVYLGTKSAIKPADFEYLKACLAKGTGIIKILLKDKDQQAKLLTLLEKKQQLHKQWENLSPCIAFFRANAGSAIINSVFPLLNMINETLTLEEWSGHREMLPRQAVRPHPLKLFSGHELFQKLVSDSVSEEKVTYVPQR